MRPRAPLNTRIPDTQHCFCYAATPEAGTWETYTVSAATQNPGQQQAYVQCLLLDCPTALPAL